MSKSCEEVRPLLVDLEYDEIDAAGRTALEAHLDACEACRLQLAAFQAVRADLSLLNEVKPAPGRVTFVAMPSPQPAAASGWSTWSRGLAAAASFVFGLLLVAAFFNTQISSTANGWTLSTSLWDRPAVTEPAAPTADGADTTAPTQGPVTPIQQTNGGARPGVTPVGTNSGRPVSPAQGADIPVGRFMSEPELESWLDERLQARNLGGTSARPVNTLHPDEVEPILEQLMQERDAQWRSLVGEMLTASEVRQREEINNVLVGVYEAFDAQRTNDLFFLAGELGLLQENTGLELQRTNAAIDYLITRAAQRSPEERDEQ